MDLKKKYEDVKAKIEENRDTIIAVVSTVISAGIAISAIIAYVNANEKLKKAYAANREILAGRNLTYGAEAVFISDETKQKIVDGSKDTWFDVDGHRFDLILHPNED